MGDLNLINALFDQDNSLFGLEKDELISKLIEKPEEEPNGWFSDGDDALLSFMPLFESILNGGNDILLNAVASECSSDSGLSCEQSFSPTRSNDVDDFQSPDFKFLEDVRSIDSTSESTSAVKPETWSKSETVNLSVDEKPFDAFEFVKEEVVEYEEVPVEMVCANSSDSNSMSDVYILESDSNDGLNESDYLIENPLLVRYPKSRTVKLANNRGKRSKNVTNFPSRNIQQKRKSFNTSEIDGSDDSDFLYPRLQLTPEEQKLAVKESIKFPTHYPLTKAEERELKRIRRKIRNKISAQDSRRRKKEQFDTLEENMKRTSEENANLMKRIKILENQRLNLVAQVRKLQASLARCSGQTTKPSTCLLVLIMSLALVLAPTLKNSTSVSDNEDEGISLSEDLSTSSVNSVRSSSRNLLFSHKAHEGQCNIEEETKAISEQLQKMQIPDSNVLTGLLEMLKMKISKESSLLKDHDYFRPRKRQNSTDACGDSRLSSKLVRTSEHVVNAVIMGNHNKTGNVQFQEPAIIDLLSD